MQKLLALTIFLVPMLSKSKTSSPEILYSLSISKPQTHYAEIEIEIKNHGKNQLELQMPVWTPGSYLVREFEKSVQEVTAYSGNKSVDYLKKDKNTWTFKTAKDKPFKVRYRVYAFEFSVRTSFIDADQALINPGSACMLIKGFESVQGLINIKLPAQWSKISTSLNYKSAENGVFSYSYGNYDELADSPIQMGNHQELTFSAAGVPHKVAMVGVHNADTSKFVKDLVKVCNTMNDIIGEHPCSQYLFIVQNVESGGGGLEHKNSTVVMMNRHNWKDPAKYKSFLGLCAHEYFHLWNVKRIRPVELGPFNYSAENYTSQLWVAEGITSYYDELAMMRAGFVTPKEFITTLTGYVNDLENRPGSRVQTLAESSWDAWIKEYRPNENSKNTTISYYSKGLVVAALLDAEICKTSNGKKNLDDLMKLLWNKNYKAADKGFTPAEFEQAASETAGKDLTAFFNLHVRSLETPQYEKIWAATGISVNIEREKKYLTGITTLPENNKTMAKMIEDGSPAWEAGVNVNDEIIAANGFRVNNDLDDILKKTGNPANVTLLVSRTGIIREIKLSMKMVERFSITLKLPTDQDSWPPVLKKWLGN